MLTLLRIRNINEKAFRKAYELYQHSFPEEEQRSLLEQEKLLALSYYRYDLLMLNNDFAGFMLWFEFPDMCFIEHVAILPRLRGKGIGKQAMEGFTAKHQKTVVLEVELPTSEINQRRIKFYQRLGFHFNHFVYYQPPLKEGGEKLELRLMTYPEPITMDFINDFVATFHPLIYG